DARRPSAATGRSPDQEPVARLALLDGAGRRNRAAPGTAAGAGPAARRRLPALRRRVPPGDRRGGRPAQYATDPDPLRGPLRRPGRRPAPADRPRQRRPVRLATGKPPRVAVKRPGRPWRMSEPGGSQITWPSPMRYVIASEVTFIASGSWLKPMSPVPVG